MIFIIVLLLLYLAIYLFVFKEYKNKLLKMKDSPFYGLTSQGNKRVKTKMEELRKYVENHRGEYSISYIEIDNIHHVDQTFGQQEGDDMIKKVTNLISSKCHGKEMMIPYRRGEYLLISKHKSSYVEELIKKVFIGLRRINMHSSKPYKIEISYGISNYQPSINQSFERLINLAKKDLHLFKQRKMRNKRTVISR